MIDGDALQARALVAPLIARGRHQRHLGRVVVALSLLLSACAHAPARPFATASLNLGFEETSQGRPAGWDTGPLGRFDVAHDTATVRSGKHSVRITSTAAGRYGSLSRRIAASPLVGKRVRLHGWVRTQAVTGSAVVFLRVDGGQSAYEWSRPRPYGSSSGWTEVVADIVVAPGKDVTLGVSLIGDGTAWFDDLSLEILEPAPAVPIDLAGRVIDSAGTPVGGAEVALIAGTGAVAEHVRAAANGQFTFRATAGTWALSAHAPDRKGLAGAFVESRHYSSSAAHTLVLGAERGVRVQGRVPGPVPAGAFLRVAAYSSSSGDVWAVPLGTDGTFDTTLPRADRFAISVLSGGRGTGDARREGEVANAVLDVVVERPAPPSVRQWISQNAIPLKTADPGVPLVLSAALRRLVGSSRVVALGEATHGTREFFQLKHRVFQTLVAEGFTVFALEAGQVEARAINAYVLNGTGNARAALGEVGMWMWETEEFLSLIEWMRRWNADPTHTRKLQFVGFDMQNTRASLTAVRQFLDRVAPANAAAWLTPIDMLKDDEGSDKFEALPKEKQAEVIAACVALTERFARSQQDWEAATSVQAFAIAQHDARLLLQSTEHFAAGQSAAASVLRDKAMAENIMWLHDHLPAGTRMVVSAHNEHIADVPARLGKSLRATLGSAWLTIGMELGDGTFQAQRARTDGARLNIESIQIPAPGAHLASAALLAGGPNVYALDLRTIPATGEVAAWFRAPQFVREEGYVFRSVAAMTVLQVLAERFDALLFVAHTTRARPLAIDFTRLP